MSQSDQRLAQLQHWTTAVLHEVVTNNSQVPADFVLNGWQPVSGDASFRRYFRTEFQNQSYIVMDAPPPKEDIAPFIDIAERLLSGGIHAPRIFAQQLDMGFLLLQDLGDQMLQSMLQPENGQKLFDQVLPVLSAMAADCSGDDLPEYSAEKLQQELDLFPDWYLQKHLGLSMSAAERQSWQALQSLLVDNALAQPQVFVHRDFHSCNLHQLADGGTGVIDFQDAVRGPITYDLASWLWDRYITWPRDKLERWMTQAGMVLAPDIDTQDWIRYCDLMGLQRNLKIIGIFARLHYRDNKNAYLEMIPRFSDYVIKLLPIYPELKAGRVLLEKYLNP